jgi:hypothetical protein
MEYGSKHNCTSKTAKMSLEIDHKQCLKPPGDAIG